MKVLVLEYRIPNSLAKKMTLKGINFHGVSGKLMIDNHVLKLPDRVFIGSISSHPETDRV